MKDDGGVTLGVVGFVIVCMILWAIGGHADRIKRLEARVVSLEQAAK